MATPGTAALRLLAGEREPVRVATTGNITLSGLQTIDGVAGVAGMRVLVWQQTDATANGIYEQSAGTWFRAPDARQSRTINKGVTVHVQSGTTLGGNVYVFRTLNPNIGDDDIDIELFFNEGLYDDILTLVSDAISTVIGGGGAAEYATRALAAAATVPTALTYLRTHGYATVGDGGHGLYKKVVSDPGAGGFQTANSLWFALVTTEPNILQFGASTAAADNYTAFSDTASFATSNGRASFFVPAGRFDIDMTGKAAIAISGGIHGTPSLAAILPAATPTNGGSIIGVKGTTASPFDVKSRVMMRDFAMLWPDQTNPAAPTVYPAAFALTSAGSVLFENVTMVNPYVGILMENDCGFIWVNKCKIGAFKQAIRFNQTTAAENWFTNNAFTFGTGYDFYAALGSLAAWQTYYLANSVGIEYRGAHSDAQQISGNVFVGTNKGVHATYTGTGDSFLWGKIEGNTFDGCQIGIHMENKTRPQSMRIVGNDFQALAPSTVANNFAIALAIAGNANGIDATITGNRFSVIGQTHILISGDNSQPGTIAINANTFYFAGFGNAPGTYDSTFISGDTFDVTYTGNICDGGSGGQGVYAFKAQSITATGNMFKTLSIAVKLGTVSKAVVVGNTEQNGGVVNGTASVEHHDANNSWS